VSFARLAENFHWLRYAGCSACMAYTRNDSIAKDKWAEKHRECGQYIFFDAPPGVEWTPELGDIEALAAVVDNWEKEVRDGAA
jgi:hypothetical protein